LNITRNKSKKDKSMDVSRNKDEVYKHVQAKSFVEKDVRD